VSQPAVCVEFLGLPGVGKSTLSHRVAQILIQKGIRVEQISYQLSHRHSRSKRVVIKLYYVICEILLHPAYAYLSIATIIRTRQKTVLDLCKVVFNWLFVSALIRKPRQFAGVHLFDEGIFQALCSVAFSSKSGEAERMSALFPIMPIPRMVVVVEASMASINLRLTERQRHDSRLEKKSPDSRDLLMRFAELLTDIKKKLVLSYRPHKEIAIREVDNDSAISLGMNADLIAADVERIFKAWS
jgi:deoxyadenosine/deoxycytidine kinase